MEQNKQKEKNWTVVYMRKKTKDKLDKLKCYSESYDAAIQRLIIRRNFDIVNSQVVGLQPLTLEVNNMTVSGEKGQPVKVKVEGTIGR